MDKIIISHKSALSLLRHIRCSKIVKENYFSESITKADLQNIINKPIDIMVDSKNNFCKNDIFKYHLKLKGVNQNSLIKLNNTFYCCSPELVIIQLANKLSFEQLFLLISELTGSYSIDEQNHNMESSVSSITSMSKIRNYESKLRISNPHYHGHRLLHETLQYICGDSASPMESKLYLKLCGPRKRGYYACKNLEFNKEIKLSIDARKIAGQDYVKPDIVSKQFKVAVEYDSSQFHTDILQNQKDKARRDALVYDGWKVHTIIPSMVNDPSRFDVLAKSILKDICQSSRIRHKNFEKLRNDSFRLLL